MAEATEKPFWVDLEHPGTGGKTRVRNKESVLKSYAERGWILAAGVDPAGLAVEAPAAADKPPKPGR